MPRYVLGTKEPIATQEPISNVPQNEPGLLSRLGFALVKGTEVPGQLFNTLAGLIGEPQTYQPISEDIRQKLGYTQEQLQPKGNIESYAQRFLGQAPTAAAFGPAALLRTAIGNVPATGLKAAGFSEPIQDIAQLGTELGLGIKGFPKLGLKKAHPSIEKATKQAYENTKEIGKLSHSTETKPILNAINQVSENLGTELNREFTKEANFIMNKVGKITEGGKIDPNKIFDLRTSLNDLASRMPASFNAKYIAPIRDSFEDYFVNHALKDPKYYLSLKHADKLQVLKGMETKLPKLIDYFDLKKIPLGVRALDSILKKGAHETERFFRSLASNKAATDYYFKAIKASIGSHPALAAKYIQKMTDYMPILKKEEKEIGVQAPKGKRFQLSV